MSLPDQGAVTIGTGGNHSAANADSEFVLLAATTRKILEEKDISRVLQAVCEEACCVLGAERSLIVRISNSDPSQREILSSHNVPQEFIDSLKASRTQSILRAISQEKHIRIFSDIEKESKAFDPAALRKMGLRAVCGIPLIYEESSFAALVLYHLTPKEYTPQDREVAEAFGALAAVAIDKAHLVESLKTGLQAQKSLQRALNHITSSQNVNEIIRAVLSESERVMGTKRCAVNLPSPHDGHPHIFESQGVSPNFFKQISSLPEPFPIAQAYIMDPSRDKPTVVPDATADPLYGPIQASEGHKSLVCFPLRLEGRNIGTLFYFYTFQPEMDDQTLALGQAFAGQVAATLEKARLRAEAESSRNFFQSIMDDNADAMSISDKDQKVVRWNEAAEKLYGYSAEEMLGQQVKRLIPNDCIGDLAIGKEVRASGKNISFDTYRVKKDGTRFPVNISISSVRDAQGDMISSCTIHRDLTHRHLQEVELRRAKEEAEGASQAKSQFLSTMSHELRSPLNAVIGFSDLLMRDSMDEMTMELAPKIHDSGKYLLAMIEEILDLDRIEAGKVTLNIEPTTINDLVSGVVSSWHPRMPVEFSLSLDTDPTCGMAPCDSTRIQQILNNLIDNAIKYSPDGSPIDVQTHTTPYEVWVSVSDKGMGIEPNMKEAIFERFHQLESGYKRRAGGLGIGLALAKELMAMHGGRIWVESEAGRGSTFTFALPRTRVGVAPGSNHDNGGKASSDEEPWSGRNILIVDDVDHYHEYINRVMKDAALLESAYNGVEAIEKARQVSPHLIIMDIRMPVMDGLDAIKQLKSDPETRAIPILAMTAQVMADDRDRAFQAGADGLVTKPVDIKALTKEMVRVLGVNV